MSEKNDVRCVTRFEVIDPLGRRLGVRSNIEAHFQDDGRTLKVFVPVKVKLRPEEQCFYEGERPASDVEGTSLVKSTLEDLKVDRAADTPKIARFSMYTAAQLDAVEDVLSQLAAAETRGDTVLAEIGVPFLPSFDSLREVGERLKARREAR